MNAMIAVVVFALAMLGGMPASQDIPIEILDAAVGNDAEPPDAAPAPLDELAAKREPAAALTASFRQTTIMPDDVLSASGTIAYSRPRMLAVRFADPELVYLMDAERVHEYDAELGQLQTGPLDNAPEVEVLFAAFGQDLSRLEDIYEVTPFTPVDAPEGAQGLELRPRHGDADHLFETARLHLRPDDALPYRIEIVNTQESRVIYELDDVRAADAVDPALFALDLPPGTRVIEGERLVETVGEGGKTLSLTAEENR